MGVRSFIADVRRSPFERLPGLIHITDAFAFSANGRKEGIPFLCLLDLSLQLGDVRQRRVAAQTAEFTDQAEQQWFVLRLFPATDGGGKVNDHRTDMELAR